SVSERIFDVPVCTLPKLRVAGFGLRVPGGKTPVPVSATAKLGFDPFEVIERLPLKLPADEGVNVKVKVVLRPAFRVRGRVRPLRLKPGPVIVACEIVRVDPPELVSVCDKLLLLPT